MIRLLQRGWQRPGWANWLALPISLLYRFLVTMRLLGYRWGIFASHRLPVPVIVVGNVSVGGTGKTPLVIALIDHLNSQGRKPGIVSRGYRGNSGSWPRILAAGDSAAEVGDEPLLLFRRTGVPVAVGPTRVSSAHLLLDKFACDIIVSDDGFQHFALERDIDIVVVDGERGFGNGWCLPAGPLREPRSAISRADMLVVNGTSETALPGGFSMMLQPQSLALLGQPQTVAPLTSLCGRTVHAVAALGNPQRFFDLLEKNGLVVLPHVFDDHHQYIDQDFDFVNAGDVVIMTEKDAVKCAGLNISATCWVLAVAALLDPAFYPDLDHRLKTL